MKHAPDKLRNANEVTNAFIFNITKNITKFKAPNFIQILSNIEKSNIFIFNGVNLIFNNLDLIDVK